MTLRIVSGTMHFNNRIQAKPISGNGIAFLSVRITAHVVFSSAGPDPLGALLKSSKTRIHNLIFLRFLILNTQNVSKKSLVISNIINVFCNTKKQD